MYKISLLAIQFLQRQLAVLGHKRHNQPVLLAPQSKAVFSRQSHYHRGIITITTAHGTKICYATNDKTLMPQVIIVSNRLPISVKKEDGKLSFFPSVGGLATGLSSYVDDRRNRWIGWPGIASDELTDEDKQEIVRELSTHNYTPVFLSHRQIDNYYNGYSNSVLWPLFHNLRRKQINNPSRTKWE